MINIDSILAAAEEYENVVRRSPPELKSYQATKAAIEELIKHRSYLGRNPADDFKALLTEWRNDVVIVSGDETDRADMERVYAAAKKNPDGEFLAWVKARLEKPCWMSRKAWEWLNRRNKDTRQVLQLEAVWFAELMWAFVMMQNHPDDRVALLAARWYFAAAVSTTEHFKEIVLEWERRHTEDPGYATMPEALFGHDEIFERRQELMRDAESLARWRPCWLLIAERKYKADLDRRSAPIEAMSAKVRELGRKNALRLMSRNIAGVFLRARPARFPDIVEEAVDAGLGPDQLVEAERRFARMLFEQKVELVDPNGLGRWEFVAWLRSKVDPIHVDLPEPEKLEERRREMIGTRKALRRGGASETLDFMRYVPAGYEILGGGSREIADEWVAKAAAGELPLPECKSERMSAASQIYADCGCIFDDRAQLENMYHAKLVHFLWFLVKRRRDEAEYRIEALKATQLAPQALPD